MKNSLGWVTHEVEQLDCIEVNGINFKLEVFLSGDWKFLALILGLDAANSNHSCLWCKCPSKERHDLIKMWSLTDRKHGARWIEEIIAKFSLPKSVERYNCSHRPVFPSIPIDHVMDTLHLFLRITDLLTKLTCSDSWKFGVRFLHFTRNWLRHLKRKYLW